MEFLHRLNPRQRQAVTADEGQILVLAGPGSGKTRVLTQRIAYLIHALGVRPYHINAVTFTNKAAREMESRLRDLVGSKAEDVWLGTFHAICARILRREADLLPFTSSFIIMDADDQLSLVKRILKEFNLDDKLYRPASIHAVISNAKNDLILPQDYSIRGYRDEITTRVYERYQKRLLASNAVDFDDLLMLTVNLLEENPRVREQYGRRFKHVLVDEFQDTNHAQYELLRHLASYHQNLFVVGDEDQSIYRWRGADYRNVIRFEQDYPQSQKILLEQNYRSSQNVLDAARSVIDHNPYRTPKKLFSERGSGERIVLYEAIDDHDEAAFVVDTISQQLMNGRAKGSDFAVMYRTNAQSRLLEEAFLRSGLRYHLVGAQRFYGRREVKDLIAFLRLVLNPVDEISLLRVINVPARGIGDKTLIALQLAARQFNCSPGEILLDLGNKGDSSQYWQSFTGRGAMVLSDFGAMLSNWRAEMDNLTLPDLFNRILSDTCYREYIDDGSEMGQTRWENVQELQRLTYEYQQRGITIFLENLALVSDQDTIDEHCEAPTLLTLHAAKGLEFSQVFITGLDEGLLPHSRSLDDPEELAEERRLFYVGVTRTKNRLYVIRAERRSGYGSYQLSEPSRFLEDIPEELIEHRGIRRIPRLISYKRKTPTRWEMPTTRSAAIIQPKFQPNQQVRHPKWGEGMVLKSRIEDDDEIVEVQFESVGLKYLIASLAKLETIPS